MRPEVLIDQAADAGADGHDAGGLPAQVDAGLIRRIVEAALLSSGQPLPLAQLRDLFPEDAPAPNGAIELALEQLRDESAMRGVELVEVASGFRFQIKADVHAWVARLSTDRQTRYTRATLETLALIAYRQPITRGEIEQVRGVSVSSNIIRALEEREWIRVVGHRDVPGRPALYGTTRTFLDYFGLKRLDELPPLSELRDIGELEPQLQFDAPAAPIPASLPADDGPGPAGETSPSDVAGEAAGELDDDDTDDGLDFRSERPVVFDAEADADGTDTFDRPTADDPIPEAAPGSRAVHENDHAQDNAVETTTVPPMTAVPTGAAESQDND